MYLFILLSIYYSFNSQIFLNCWKKFLNLNWEFECENRILKSEFQEYSELLIKNDVKYWNQKICREFCQSFYFKKQHPITRKQYKDDYERSLLLTLLNIVLFCTNIYIFTNENKIILIFILGSKLKKRNKSLYVITLQGVRDEK